MPAGRPRLGLQARIAVLGALVVLVVLSVALLVVVVAAPQLFTSVVSTRLGRQPTAFEVAAFMDALGTALLLALAAAAIAGIVLAAIAAAHLAGPYRRLVETGRSIGAGHYAERVGSTGDADARELARALDALADALERGERRRLELVGDVAHELRTPLTVLDGYLEGLADGALAGDARTWERLRAETVRLGRLIDDLQSLWRAEARQVALTLEPVVLEPVLAEVVERFAPAATSRRIRLDVEPGAGQLVAIADRARLAQVLDNLVANAVRYGADGGHVAIEVRQRRDAVIIAVRDDGPGLTTEQLERVFERFYRAEPSRSRELGGAGLGLAIARALTEAMGGRLSAESAGPGRGATFSVALPRRPDSSAAFLSGS